MRVLLAYRDANLIEVYSTALIAADHDVLTATRGEHAIRLALENRPDVILTELDLPIIDGWQVLTVLRTYSPMKEIPILALTSDAQPGDKAKALKAGFGAYLTIPIELPALLETVERAPSRAGRAP